MNTSNNIVPQRVHKSRLKGDCHLCGNCCTTRTGLRCENLEVFTMVGMPWSTRCKIHKERYDGMPITMIAKNGDRVEGKYHCALNSQAEDAVIIEMGIMKGVCSLNIE